MQILLEQLIGEFQTRRLPDLIPRSIQMKAMAGRASVVVGMRRSGKTSLCFQTAGRLEEAGVPRRRILYLNFEDDRLLPFGVADFHWVPDVFYRLFPENRREECWFFFDEIQRIPNWEMFVRRLLDSQEPVQVTLTGSSSKLLSHEVATSLRGRGLKTEIFPFSFGESVAARGIVLPERPVYGAELRSELAAAFDDYLVRGGFPELHGETNPALRREILRDYVDVATLRDVVERHGVSNVPALRALLRHLLQNPGGRFSVNRFMNVLRSQGIACGKNLVHECLSHLADAYLIYPVELHSRSVRQRQVNPRKIYAIDTGLLDAFSMGITRDRGLLLESCVFMALRRRVSAIDYALTGDGKELDFVFLEGGEKELVQASWSLADPETRKRELGALVIALDEGLGQHGTVVTAYEEEIVQAGKHLIRVVPAWRWLLEQGGGVPS